MSNSNNIPSYTFTHISSYVNGTMSREDMYTFEKAMQADPFLEDAVEGFREANISKAEKDITAIKATLLPEKESAKIIPLYTAYKTWFSAAAAIIIISTIGTVTFAILKPNNTNQQVASVTPAIEKSKAFVDTTHTVSNSPTIVIKKTSPIIAASTKQPVIVADREVVLSLAKQETVSSLQDDKVKADSFYTSSSVAKLSEKEMKSLPPTSVDQALQGKIAGVNIDTKLSKKMGPMNTINSNNGFTTNTNNTQNFFATPTQDSTQTAKNTLDEVIVVGYGTAKRKDVTGSVAKVAIDPLDSLMPVGGWQYYSKYMNQKIGFIGDTTSNNRLVIRDRTGNRLDDIDIEFSVDKEGSAYNVKVITDVDTMQVKAITNAVVEGPKWISRKKKNKVKIPLKTPCRNIGYHLKL